MRLQALATSRVMTCDHDRSDRLCLPFATFRQLLDCRQLTVRQTVNFGTCGVAVTAVAYWNVKEVGD